MANNRAARINNIDDEVESSGLFNCWSNIFHTIKYCSSRNSDSASDSDLFLSKTNPTSLRLPPTKSTSSQINDQNNRFTAKQQGNKNKYAVTGGCERKLLITDQPISLREQTSGSELPLPAELYWPPDQFHNLSSGTAFTHSDYRRWSTSKEDMSTVKQKQGQMSDTDRELNQRPENYEEELSPMFKRLLRLYVKCGADFGDDVIL